MRISGVTGAGFKLKVAETLFAALMVTVQVPVPTQPEPDQPAKTLFESAVAVRVTEVPLLKLAEQELPQAMPAGELETLPVPVPALETVNANVEPPPMAFTAAPMLMRGLVTELRVSVTEVPVVVNADRT